MYILYKKMEFRIYVSSFPLNRSLQDRIDALNSGVEDDWDDEDEDDDDGGDVVVVRR